MEVDVEVIRNLGHAYLPHLYDEALLSAPLKGHHAQPFQSLPLAKVLTATYLRGERPLKGLYGFYVLNLCAPLQTGQQCSI